jgi:hypothetical protein
MPFPVSRHRCRTRRLVRALIFNALACATAFADVLVFGDAASENAHALTATDSEIVTGLLDEPARRLLPRGTTDWQGGLLAFTLAVDPEKQNYITARFSGSDSSTNRLILLCDGRQIGYRHLGDISVLDSGGNEPAVNGRFFYITTPLPLSLTRGKSQLAFEIRSTGPIWGYGQTFDKYQKPMTEPTRGLYRIATHTDAFYVPAPDEKQGDAPAAPSIRARPGVEVIDGVKERVSGEIAKALNDKTPPNQMQMQLLAQAWRVKWTPAFKNSKAVARVIEGADQLYADFEKDPRIAEAGPASYNPEWFGLGPVGDAVQLLAPEIAPRLDEKLASGITRRDAWARMLVASRDWHRRHRRLYTNQSMINDLYGIYLSNRGVAAIAPALAAPEPEMLRYLYESVGLEPWRDSDPGGNGPQEREGRKGWAAGGDYWQLTSKGLTRELGYVGNYGEVLDWMTALYHATRPTPEQPGDAKIKAQLIKAGRARAPFRYPALDPEGHRAMRMETIVGWRDSNFPGEVTYAQRNAWDGSAIQAATATLDPQLVGYAQQMLADNQYFRSVQERMKTAGFRVTAGLLDTPDEYERLKAQPPSPHRLPMSAEGRDYAFADEQAGVVALKRGDEVLYVSLYWRARYAINFLARVHHLTPRFERIATVRQETEFTPSGLHYTRRDWTNFGFGNGGPRYPEEVKSAHAGEELPIAKIPDDVAFTPGDENAYAGKGSFYTLRYGPYLIGMNCTADRTYRLAWPAGLSSVRDLVSGTVLKPDADQHLAVGPRTTVVLWLDTDAQTAR